MIWRERRRPTDARISQGLVQRLVLVAALLIALLALAWFSGWRLP